MCGVGDVIGIESLKVFEFVVCEFLYSIGVIFIKSLMVLWFVFSYLFCCVGDIFGIGSLKVLWFVVFECCLICLCGRVYEMYVILLVGVFVVGCGLVFGFVYELVVWLGCYVFGICSDLFLRLFDMILLFYLYLIVEEKVINYKMFGYGLNYREVLRIVLYVKFFVKFLFFFKM